MNNLKRVLSLGLTGAMLSGMMLVGASAASVTDFTDSSEIANKDAVSTMAALGVIKGKDTGAFDPAGNVTRGEMAKMLCVAMNGGKDPVLGVKPTPSYTDIKGHWAESYIEYCSSVGYVSGRGDGTFAPDATVTSTEAAKIILGALGYKSDISGLTGMDWAINTNVLANAADVDLYDGLSTIDTTAPMSRDNAAQMLYNALEAKMVAHNGTSYVTSTYSDNVTVKEQTGTKLVYVMTVVDGAALDAYKSQLNGTKYDSPADADAYADTFAASVIKTDYTLKQVEEPVYSISNAAQDFDETFGHKYLELTTYSSKNEGEGYIVSVVKENNKDTFTVELDNGMTFRKVETDYSELMGQKVKVLYKALDNVYGIYAHTDSEVLYSGVVDDISISGTTLKLGGTVYKTDAAFGSTKIYHTNNFASSCAMNAVAGLDKAASMKAIDNDGDGKIDLFVATPFVAAKVTYKGTDSITLNPNVAGDSSLDLEDDVNVYEGIAKNDYVVAIPGANTVDGKVALTKAETITGKIDGIKGSSSDTAKIDGTWYSKADQTISGGDTVSLNDTAMLVLVNGYYVYADINVTTSKDLAVVVGVGTANIDKDYELSLVFTDGTSKTVRGHLESDAAMAATDAGKFYTYEVDKNGVYELTLATTSNTGYDGTVGNTNFDAATDKLANGTHIADDAVVIIRYKNTDSAKDNSTQVEGADAGNIANLSKTSVITGKSLKGLSANFGATSATTGFTVKQGGLNYAQILFLAADKQTMVEGTDDSYGYIVSAPYKAKEGSDTYIVFDMWDGEDTVTVKDKVSSSQALVSPYVKGTVISFSDEGSGVVDAVKAFTTSGAVTGYNAGDKIISILTSTGYAPNATEVTSDTKYFYINTADKKGVASEGVELATELATPGLYDQNVWVKDDGNGKVLALFIDVNNKLDGTSPVGVPADDNMIAGSASDSDVKALDDGLYVPTDTNFDANAAGHNAADLRVFKFTADVVQTYTLTIGTSTGASDIYSEIATSVSAGAHFFTVDATGSYNNGNGNTVSGSLSSGTALTAGTTYYYQITGANNTVYLSGAFQG